MKNKLLLFFLMFLTFGCYQTTQEYMPFTTCPRVQIRKDDQKIKQFAAGQDLFEIEMVSYSGRCSYDEKTGQTKAFITPIFHLTRLTKSNVEDVHFSYYLETAEGPSRFLGKKTYFEAAHITKGVWNLTWKGKESDGITIPNGEYDVDMYAGLYAVKADSEEKVSK